MQSIFAKLRTISLSNLHTLLNWTDGLNSIGSYEQYIRDLETARNQLDDQAAAGRGRKSFLDQQIATAKAHMEAADEQINVLLGDDDPSNDNLAIPLQLKLDTAREQVAAAETELVSVNAQVGQYDNAVQRLDVRLAEAKGKLSALRSQEKATRASEKAASALDGINLGAAPDTSGVEARMAEKSAVAANALNRSLAGVTNAVGGVTSAEASAVAAIALRKKKLAEQKAAQPA